MIDVKNLHKYFGSLEVLKGIDCHIDKGECVCVIGHLDLERVHF